ncbi:MAG: glucose-6-phosphate isomerase [Candidatus Cryosericum sp.]
MTNNLHLDDSWAFQNISPERVDLARREAASRLQMLMTRTGRGAEYTGWVDLPVATAPDMIAHIEETAAELRNRSEIVVVCGIGGSYLGARAGIEFLNSTRTAAATPEILFLGNSLSPWHLSRTLEKLVDRPFSVIVISKSGTTLETALAFHVLREELRRRYGPEGARERMVAITERERGTLRSLADEDGIAAFDMPVDVGGRYSVLTAVGLLPFAVAGFDIRAMLEGAARQRSAVIETGVEDNDALRYAAARRLLNAEGRQVELFADFEPFLHTLGEWWKQLFGESEGKEHRGLFPASVDYTTDLHSLGQFVQEGTPCHFETVVDVPAPVDFTFSCDASSPDGLAYLDGHTVGAMNRQAMLGTIMAHHDGGVPVLRISLPDVTERTFGAAVYFFEAACAVSSYMLGINPFDQPGVEAYKHNMFALLGKPGTETEGMTLRTRLGKWID